MKAKWVVCYGLLWLAVGTFGNQTVEFHCSNQHLFHLVTPIFSGVSIDGSTIPIFLCDKFDLEYVTFEKSSMEEMPKHLFERFRNIRFADFTHCDIKYVNRYNLEHAYELHDLDLSRNALNELTANCFSGGRKLEQLNLSYNNISSIDATAFNSLINLASLLLTGNKLQALDSKVFSSLAALKTIYLDFNELQVLERGLFSRNVQLQNILLHNNRISVIEEGTFFSETHQALKLEMLSLSNNNLTKLNLRRLNVTEIHLTNNTLEEFHLSPWMESVYAANNSISSILMDNSSIMKLKTLYLRNNSITSFESIQHLDSLLDLYLSDNRIGSLNLTSLAKFTKLEYLGLGRTFISNLQPGIFAQQESLKWLDLSDNNLDRFDFDILTSSTALQNIYLDGNRLKSLNFQHLKQTFPSLVEIGVTDNFWNCTFLSQLVCYCREHSIALPTFESHVVNKTNVKGIFCYDDKNPLANWNTTMQQMQTLHPHLHNSSEDAVAGLQTLLQSVQEDVRRYSDRHEEIANQTTKLDETLYDLTKNQLNLQKDLNSLRQSLSEIQLALISNRTNDSVGVDAHISGGSSDHGLIMTVVILMCMIIGVSVFGFVKFKHRLFNFQRNRVPNRDNSLVAIIKHDI